MFKLKVASSYGNNSRIMIVKKDAEADKEEERKVNKERERER